MDTKNQRKTKATIKQTTKRTKKLVKQKPQETPKRLIKQIQAKLQIKPFQMPATIHKDCAERLQTINPSLAKSVRQVLDVNKSERHIRGGLATKEKYLHMHENV